MAATFKNFALAVLAAPLAVGQTTAELAGADAMPQISGAASHYYAVLQMPGDTSQVEIVKVISNPVNNRVTIVRAQEGTVQRAFPVGALFENRVTLQGMNEAYVRQASPVFGAEIDATSGINIRAALRSTSLTGAAKEVLQAAGTNVRLGNANAGVSIVSNVAPKAVIGGVEHTLLHSGSMGVGSGIDAEKLGGKSYTLWGALDEAERVQQVWNFSKGVDVENANGNKFLAIRGTSEFSVGSTALTIQVGDGSSAINLKAPKVVVGHGTASVIQAANQLQINNASGARQGLRIGALDASSATISGDVHISSSRLKVEGKDVIGVAGALTRFGDASGGSAVRIISNSAANLSVQVGSNLYKIYNEGSKPTASEVGAAPASHTHTWGQVTGAPATATRWPTWGEVSGKPSTMPPSAHTHDDRYLGINGTAKDAINLTGITTSITITGDANTYYPVVISGTFRKEFPTFVSVWKDLASTTNSSYEGNHPVPKSSSLWLQYETRTTIWDGNGGYHKTLHKSEPYATLVAETNSLGKNSGDLTVWLRGGGTQYYITTDNPSVKVEVYYTSTQITSLVSVAPRTTIGNRGIYNTVPLGYGSITWDQVTRQPATATRWPTFAEVSSKPATATRWPTFAEVSSKPTNYPTTWESVAAKPATATRWPTLTEIGAQPAGSYAAASHTHPWSQVTGAPATATRWPTWAEVTSKPTTFAPSAHDHSWSNITSGVPATATRWPTWAEVTSKPTTFAPSAHDHSWSDITSGVPATATRWPTWSEVSSKPTTFTPASHSHGVFEEHTTLFNQEVTSSGTTIYMLAQPWSDFDAIMTLASDDSRNQYSSNILTKKQLDEMYAKAVPAESRSWLLHASTETLFYWRMIGTSKKLFQIARENGILYKIIGIKYNAI